MARRKVILRADGNNKIGLGHVYRSLALAEMLKEDFQCVFAINNPDEFVVAEINKSCSSLINLHSTLQYQTTDQMKAGDEIEFDLEEYLTGNEIVVTDGYLFGEKYQVAVKAKGAKLVCIDDLAINHFFADAVINHAPGINRSLYKLRSNTILLTGLDYAMIRQPFFKLFNKKNYSERNAFISLGGSDYFQYTKRLVEILLQDDSFQSLHVLTSSSFSSTLLSDLNKMSCSARFTLHFNLNADELVSVMDSCTHAFVAASTVLIEAYSRGLKCFAGYYTENQKLIYKGFINHNLAEGLGSFNELTKKIVSEKIMNEKNIHYLVGPLSPTEIPKVFNSLCDRKEIREVLNYKLREVIPSDINLLFVWANDLEVRNNAVNTEKITFDEHTTWFNKKINSASCRMFVLELDDIPAGQARFDFNDIEKIWEIDYSIAKEFRGFGLSKLLLTESIRSLHSFPFAAYVKKDNTISQNVFSDLGFTSMGLHTIKNSSLVKYVKSSAL